MFSSFWINGKSKKNDKNYVLDSVYMIIDWRMAAAVGISIIDGAVGINILGVDISSF